MYPILPEHRDERRLFHNKNVLTTPLLIDAAMFSVMSTREPHDDLLLVEVQKQADSIQEQVKRFEDRVWLNGLGKQFMDMPTAGARAELGHDDKLLIFTTAGRVLLTFSRRQHNITLITDDEVSEPRMGIQSIHAEVLTAVSILYCAITIFREEGLHLVEDKNVGIG